MSDITPTTIIPSTNINSLLSSVPKLNGKNYRDWKFAITMVLRRAGLWSLIAEYIEKKCVLMEMSGQATQSQTTWALAKAEESKAKESEEILTITGLTIEPSQYIHIEDCTDGIAAWSALSELYEKNSQLNRF